jgi:predicted dehydrogenase
MKRIVKIGVIGCSKIAQRLILPTIHESLHYELIIVGSSDSNKYNLISEKYNCQCGSYIDVLNNKDVEAVYVSLPNSLHYYWGKEVLKNGGRLLYSDTDSIFAAYKRDVVGETHGEVF